jgi:hypothetical protein
MTKRPSLAAVPNVTSLVALIFLLDGYRVNRFENPAAVEKAVRKGDLGGEISRKWKEIRPSLDKMASLPASIPGVVRLTQVRIAFRFLASAYTSAALMLVVARFVLRLSYGEFGEWFVISAAGVVPVAWLIGELANYRIAKKVEESFEKNPRSLEVIRSDLKKTVQTLLYTLFRHIRRAGQDPKKFAFKMYNADYEGIEVVRMPTRWAKYYLVSIKS